MVALAKAGARILKALDFGKSQANYIGFSLNHIPQTTMLQKISVMFFHLF